MKEMLAKLRFTAVVGTQETENGKNKKLQKEEQELLKKKASPINCLDEIMNNTEQRCIVLMTGLDTQYSVSAMAREINREFKGTLVLLLVGVVFVFLLLFGWFSFRSPFLILFLLLVKFQS